jgi:type IV secretion system protein VirD4
MHFSKKQPETRVLRAINGEGDLVPFQQIDPHMLMSKLHGEARFGWLQHLWRAGMFMTNDQWAAARHRGYPLAAVWFKAHGGLHVEGFVHWPHEGHRLIIGAPGSGKFTCALAPLLLDDDGANAFIIDPKGGEAATWSMVYRNGLNYGTGDYGVELLDPCGVFPNVASQALNPLDVIRPNNPHFVADAEKLAEALVPDENAKDPFWARAGRKVVRALMIHVASWPDFERRSLLEVQDAIARGPDDATLEEMADNNIADGLVARDAATISGWKNAEGMWQGIKAQVDASLMFLDLPGVRRTLAQTDFDVADLRRKRKSLYVVIPNKEKETLGRWLRLIYTSVMDQIDAVRGRPVHVVVDEFAALGKFERILTDLATLRSAGFRYHLAIQDLNQLNELYGHGWQTIVGNCALKQFLGVNDNFTAEYVSHALGVTTVQDGYDYQQEFADAPQQKRPRWVARQLRTPAEILGLQREDMIILNDRTRPFLLPKCHYFETAPWQERATDARNL